MLWKNLSNNQILLILLGVGIVVYICSKKTKVVEGWTQSCRSRVNKESRRRYGECYKEMLDCQKKKDTRTCRKEVSKCYGPIIQSGRKLKKECQLDERELRTTYKKELNNVWDNILKGKKVEKVVKVEKVEKGKKGKK